MWKQASRVAAVLQQKSDFQQGGSIWQPFIVEDGKLITARYPADAQQFAQRLIEQLG
ncbi:MAG TPA: hypothetical protein VF458_16495 [Ktedonobacteraceae bacterium]